MHAVWGCLLLVTFCLCADALIRCNEAGCFLVDAKWKRDNSDDGMIFMPNADAYEKALQARGRFGFGLGKRKRSVEGLPFLNGQFGEGYVAGKELVPALFPTFLVVDPEPGKTLQRRMAPMVAGQEDSKEKKAL